MGTVFYGYKIYSGSSCSSTPIFEHSSPPGIPWAPEGYSSSFPGIYSSSDPYSAYSADHGSAVGAEISSTGPGGPYKRSSVVSQKRSNEGDSKPSFDFGDLAFTVLGVESKECRKRFICEMSVNYNRNPIVGSAYKMISKQFFPEYMKEIDTIAPRSLKQCAESFPECRSPNDPAPVPEKIDNELDASEQEGDTKDVEEGRAVASPGPKPVLMDQVQRFVVGSKKIQ